MNMKTAFAIAAHPDDIEFLMSGTLMQLAESGYELHYLNVANGCCGTAQFTPEEIITIRRREGQMAAEALGAIFHESLVNDLEIFYERETLARLTSIVREVSPQIVLTHALSDYMEDHTNTARLAVTATFCRGMPNFPVQPPRDAIDTQVTLYHAQPYSNHDPMRKRVYPELYVDVSDLQDRKCDLLSCHASQKKWLDQSQGLDSYLRTLRQLDADVGQMSGKFAAAEGWRRHLHLGFGNEADDPLSDALAARVFSNPDY